MASRFSHSPATIPNAGCWPRPDVQKNDDWGNDSHGSKVIVIPFDVAALDRDLQTAASIQ
jgi:hypothetical protein